MAARLLLPGNVPTGRKMPRKTLRKTPQDSHPPAPHLACSFPSSCPAAFLPQAGSHHAWALPPCQQAWGRAALGGMLNFGDLIPASWLKHVPRGGFLTPAGVVDARRGLFWQKRGRESPPTRRSQGRGFHPIAERASASKISPFTK